MFRVLILTAILLATPAFASAQYSTGFGGGVAGPSMVVPGPSMVGPGYRFGGGLVGGFVGPGYALGGIGGGYGYGYAPYYGYGFSGDQFSPFAPQFDFAQAPPLFSRPVQQTLVLANQFPATLVLDFPAAAEVWVAGTKGEGEPNTEWTLTSPTLQPGERYTFDVKARWKADGKTLEYNRSFTVAAGDRSRAHVLSGVPVKE
jgi:uncharacterized protein (TIGR03000 family)